MNAGIAAAFIAAAALLGAQGSEAPETAVRASVSVRKATVGDLLTYRIVIAGPGLKGVAVSPPQQREFIPEEAQPKASSDSGEDDASRLIPLYIIHSIKKEDRSSPDRADISVTMSISFYRPGKYRLPEIEIKGKDGIVIGYKVPEVEIAAVNPKGEFMEIEDPLSLGGNYWRLAFLLLGAALIGASAFFAWRYARRKLSRAPREEPALPPIDLFMKGIENLEGERLIEEGRVEEYVFGISMLFRRFLSLQFGFDATEMTTHEIERQVRRIFPRALFDRRYEELMRILTLWDLSKFAEFMPTREALAENLRATVNLARRLAEEGGDVLGV